MSSSAKPISGADWAIIALSVMLGAVVLGTRLSWQDYWWDEHVTLMFTRVGWRELLIDYWGVDTHRPVYYALQKGWNGLFGESVAAVRALPVVLTLLTVPVFFGIARQIDQGPIAALTVLLLVSTPAFVYQGREIRMYCLLNLSLSVALLLLMILATRARSEQSGISRKTALQWAGVSVALAVAFYAHAITAFVAVLFGLWILLAVVFRLLPLSFLWQALIAGGLWGLLIAPALLPFFMHLGGTLGESFWVPDPSFRYVYEQTATVFAFSKWGKLLFAILLVWGFWSLRRKPLIGLLLAIMLIGFPLMVLLFSFLKPIYMTRVIAWSGFVSVLVLAAGLADLRRSVRWICVVLLLISQGLALAEFYPDTEERSPYEAFRDTFADFEPDTDTLILGDQTQEPALRWYFPHILEGKAYGFIPGDRNRNVIDAAFLSKFVPREAADDIQLSPGRLFVFQEIESAKPIAPEGQVQEALEEVIGGYQKIGSQTHGRFQLDIYNVE